MENKNVISSDAVIRVRGLKKDFDTLAVLKGIDVDIHKGDVVCVIGASGSGKSTFLRCLNLLEQPTGGSIEFNGVNLTSERSIWISTGRKWAWCSSSLICSPI